MQLKSKRRLGVRALSLLLLFALLLGTVSSALALTKNETVYSTALINVRSGPGTNYSVVGKLKVNDQVKYLGTSGSWAKIEYNGGTAYAYAKYLKSAGSSTSTDGGKLYATTGVNVRSGPGTSYSKLGELAKDQEVTKLGASGKWIKIAYGSGSAYVHGQYLTATKPNNTQPPSTTLAALVTLYNTPVYAGPGQAYGTLYIVNAGTTVYATGVISGDFTQVQTSSGVGYIQSSVLRGSVTPVQSPGTIITQTYAYVQADYSYGYYTTPLVVGTTVTCTGVVTNGFVQIVYGTGYAYVPQANVRVGSVNSGGTTGTTQRYVTQSTLVYQTVDSGGVASGLIATLSANTIVTCVSTVGNYTKIIFGLDYGYVLTANLSTVTTGGGTLPGYGNNSIKTDTAIYAEPRSGAAVLGFAYRNQAVYCTGVVIGDYAQVLIGTGTYGYIATNCLNLPVTPSGGTVNLGARSLASGSALYNQAYGTSANLVGFSTGITTVTLVSVVGTWSQILLNGSYYYTLSSNLSII
ncbi:MAG: SH3 domain-containing protein [Bacillota bacterium]